MVPTLCQPLQELHLMPIYSVNFSYSLKYFDSTKQELHKRTGFAIYCKLFIAANVPTFNHLRREMMRTTSSFAEGETILASSCCLLAEAVCLLHEATVLPRMITGKQKFVFLSSRLAAVCPHSSCTATCPTSPRVRHHLACSSTSTGLLRT